MTKEKLNETAGGGAVGAGGVAVRTDGPGIGGQERKRLQAFLKGFNKRIVNRWRYHQVKTPFPIKVTEAFDLQDVLSRLRGIEGKSVEPRDNVTYGVEDDEGNIMKVTVRKDQAAEFEAILAHELADIEAFSITGTEGKDVSMAELLYNLKDKFDIVDVEFPKIPTDVVYNADKATYKANDELPANDQVDDAQTGGLNGPPGGDEFGDIANGNQPMDLNDVDGVDEFGEEGGALTGGPGGLADEKGGLGGDLGPEGDAAGVEDFSEPAGSDEGSILDRVLDMLKAQAEAETAKANAEAEKYRADQAEYSARAANATVAQEEEMARMEAEMSKQKDQEKQAKKLADIAKYRVQQTSGMRVNEADENIDENSIRRAMAGLAQKWAILPTDDPDTRTYKNAQRANETRELQARMRIVKTRAARAQQLQAQGKGKNTDPNAQSPNNNQQQQNPNGQQGNNQAPQQGGNGNANQ